MACVWPLIRAFCTAYSFCDHGPDRKTGTQVKQHVSHSSQNKFSRDGPQVLTLIVFRLSTTGLGSGPTYHTPGPKMALLPSLGARLLSHSPIPTKTDPGEGTDLYDGYSPLSTTPLRCPHPSVAICLTIFVDQSFPLTQVPWTFSSLFGFPRQGLYI